MPFVITSFACIASLHYIRRDPLCVQWGGMGQNMEKQVFLTQIMRIMRLAGLEKSPRTRSAACSSSLSQDCCADNGICCCNAIAFFITNFTVGRLFTILIVHISKMITALYAINLSTFNGLKKLQIHEDRSNFCGAQIFQALLLTAACSTLHCLLSVGMMALCTVQIQSIFWVCYKMIMIKPCLASAPLEPLLPLHYEILESDFVGEGCHFRNRKR